MAKRKQRNIKSNAKDRTPGIIKLLSDENAMGVIEDMASTGASIATIEAAIGLPEQRLSSYLRKGREGRNSPYKELYRKYRKWVSAARYIAESQMAAKSPEKWLDRNTSAKLLETQEETALIAAIPQPSTLQLGAQQAIDALRIFRKSGMSIDSLLDKNEVSINNIEDKKDVD
jgi:hypothetical protein